MAVTQESARVIRFAAAADAVTTKLIVQKVIWLTPTTAAHELKLTNTAGDVLLNIKCPTGNAGSFVEVDFHLAPQFFDGLIVATMASGTCDVYVI
jgi:hypothetical protein